MAQAEAWLVVNSRGLYFKSKGLDLLKPFFCYATNKKNHLRPVFGGLSSKDKAKKAFNLPYDIWQEFSAEYRLSS